MIEAMTVNDTFEYVLDDDPCKTRKLVPVLKGKLEAGEREETIIADGATIFGLKTLDVFVMGAIYDNATKVTGRQGSNEVGVQTLTNRTNIQCVRHALTYFKNFKDRAGNDKTVKTVDINLDGVACKIADDDTMRLLSLTAIQEIAGEVKRRSALSQAQTKN